MDQIPESRKKAFEEAVVKGYGGPCVDCGRRTGNFCESCVWVEGHSGTLRENYKFAFSAIRVAKNGFTATTVDVSPGQRRRRTTETQQTDTSRKKARAAEDEKTKPREQ